LHETLTHTAERLPDRTALVCGDERWSYAQLDEQSTRLASSLRALGVGCGDRILIFLDNCSEEVLSIYATMKAGGVFVPLNGSVKARKLAYIANDSRARLLIAHTDKARVVREAMDHCSEFPRVLWVGDPSALPSGLPVKASAWDEVLDPTGAVPVVQGQRLPADGSPCIDQDLAALIYTSGSTGEPKGVMCPHGSMMAAARSIIQYLENTPDDIILNVLPLSFDYGLYQVLMAFMFGGTVVLERSFSFPVKVLERMEKERVTGFPLVPTIAAMLLRLQNLANYDLSSLRYMTNTAAALPVEHILALRGAFPHARLFSM
jgi:acyl-CoA synthetase (AMP-forming)/AMP-acid ligase II